jgi:non-ribosomal peptide synthetase component E (peptide arylation enzyme)
LYEGEKICAYIKPLAGANISHEDIVGYLRQSGAARKFIPARTEVVSEIPLTAAGKADKKALKKDIEQKLKNQT